MPPEIVVFCLQEATLHSVLQSRCSGANDTIVLGFAGNYPVDREPTLAL